MILLNIMHMLYVYYCISKTYLFMRKMNGHNTGHSTCQAYRVFQSPMEIVKCVGNQGVVRTALNSHAEREHVVRAWVRACTYRYTRENTTWAFLGVERGREEGLPNQDDHLIVTRDHEQDRYFFKVIVGIVARVATYECFVRDDNFAYNYHPFRWIIQQKHDYWIKDVILWVWGAQQN